MGNLSGKTRTIQPRTGSPSESVCLTRVSPIFTRTRSAWGVISSLPGQKGHLVPWSEIGLELGAGAPVGGHDRKLVSEVIFPDLDHRCHVCLVRNDILPLRTRNPPGQSARLDGSAIFAPGGGCGNEPRGKEHHRCGGGLRRHASDDCGRVLDTHPGRALRGAAVGSAPRWAPRSRRSQVVLVEMLARLYSG